MNRALLSSLLLFAIVSACRESANRENAGPEKATIHLSAAQSPFTAALQWQVGDGCTADAEDIAQVYSGAIGAGNTAFLASTASAGIWLVDSLGRTRSRFGRRGTGPGEFQTLRWMAALPPDSILTWDGELQRFTVFHDTGQHARSFRMPQLVESDRQLLEWAGAAGGSLFVAISPGAPDLRLTPGGPPARDTVVIHSLTLDGDAGTRIAEVAHRSWHRIPADGAIRIRVVEGSPHAVFAANDDALFWSDNDRPVITVFRVRSGDTFSLRLAADPPVRKEGGRYFDQIVATDDGLWLGLAAPSNTQRTWYIADVESRAVRGSVALPATLRILDVRGDALLGRLVDELGAECIIMYSLIR